ncbi:hypothetical protein AB6A40_002028 [Gnathostoma spinigerum]|uniref:Uncharacterized protein n=1 Tax=Gnathostoma spinigerum TaxID=75299 RepID=A0ABD6EDA8_9BILA
MLLVSDSRNTLRGPSILLRSTFSNGRPVLRVALEKCSGLRGAIGDRCHKRPTSKITYDTCACLPFGDVRAYVGCRCSTTVDEETEDSGNCT